MTTLPKEYTDVRKIRHRVEHLTLPPENDDQKERIVEELVHALTKAGEIHA